MPFVIVSNVRNTVTANDLPDPLPPVMIKYLASDENSALYLLFSFSIYKCYQRHINALFVRRNIYSLLWFTIKVFKE